MTEIRDRVKVNIADTAKFATTRTFRMLGLVADDLIPTDARALKVPADSFSDVVGITGTLYDICLRFFQANARVGACDDIYFGRWIKTASAPFWVAGNFKSDVSLYQAIGDGSFSVYDGTNTDDVTGLDYTSCTSFADVIAVNNAALAALAAPTIAGLATAKFELDALGRLRLVHSVTGAAAPLLTVKATAPASGTDMTSDAYFDAENGAALPGYDAETPLESYAALKLKFRDFWAVAPVGCSDAELVPLRAQIETEQRFLAMKESNSSATVAASTSDLASVAKALGQKRCSATFSFEGSYPQFAQFGASLGGREGEVAFGFEELANEIDSGQAMYGYVLTPTQMSALEDKSYNWIETVGGFKNAFPGRTVQGAEIRIALGKDWMVDQMQTRIYTRRIKENILGFDLQSLAIYEEEVKSVLEEAKQRRIISYYTMNVPNPDDFTDEQKESHKIDLLKFFKAVKVYDAWRYEIDGDLVASGA